MFIDRGAGNTSGDSVGKVPGSNFCICLPSTSEGAASSLRMAKAAFTLRAAYVHSYAMPVFMYHLCDVPRKAALSVDEGVNVHFLIWYELSLEHDTFDVSQNLMDFLAR